MRHFLPLALALLLPLSAAAVPMAFTHQGKLLDSTGTALQGATTITFTIYDDPSGGTLLWTETQSVDVSDGFYSTKLGESTALDGAVFQDNDALFMGISVDGNAELSPRTSLVAVPFAISALSADTAASLEAGASIDLSELTVGGETVISSDGTISYDRITGAPSDILSDLDCSAGQAAIFDGSAWACASPTPDTVDASTLTGTLSVDNLPVGNDSSSVAGGDHAHDFAELTGAAAFDQLPVGTDASSVAAGNHSHALADLTGPLSADQLPDSATFAGAITVGTTTDDCDSGGAGTIRYETNLQTLQFCDGSDWVSMGRQLGKRESNPGLSCLDILESGSSTGSGTYWVEPNGASSAFQAYCDMTTDGGGWTQIWFTARDTEGSNQQYAAVFSDVSRGSLGSGSYRFANDVWLDAFSELRYTEPTSPLSDSTRDEWAHDFACDITDTAMGKLKAPGNMNQVAAPVACTNLNTGALSTRAKNLNYQQWSGCWTGPRLWIGNDQQANSNYHGDYCADCVVTWKCSNNTVATYQGPASATANASATVAFWVR